MTPSHLILFIFINLILLSKAQNYTIFVDNAYSYPDGNGSQAAPYQDLYIALTNILDFTTNTSQYNDFFIYVVPSQTPYNLNNDEPFTMQGNGEQSLVISMLNIENITNSSDCNILPIMLFETEYSSNFLDLSLFQLTGFQMLLNVSLSNFIYIENVTSTIINQICFFDVQSRGSSSNWLNILYSEEIILDTIIIAEKMDYSPLITTLNSPILLTNIFMNFNSTTGNYMAGQSYGGIFIFQDNTNQFDISLQNISFNFFNIPILYQDPQLIIYISGFEISEFDNIDFSLLIFTQQFAMTNVQLICLQYVNQININNINFTMASFNNIGLFDSYIFNIINITNMTFQNLNIDNRIMT